jgi:hypothetical protein
LSKTCFMTTFRQNLGKFAWMLSEIIIIVCSLSEFLRIVCHCHIVIVPTHFWPEYLSDFLGQKSFRFFLIICVKTMLDVFSHTVLHCDIVCDSVLQNDCLRNSLFKAISVADNPNKKNPITDKSWLICYLWLTNGIETEEQALEEEGGGGCLGGSEYKHKQRL